MKIGDKIENEKLQYNVNREASKISVLPSGIIDKFEYLTGNKMLPSNQSQIIDILSLLILLQEKFWNTKKNN